MSEELITSISAIVGILVFLYCLIFKCIKGNTKKQKQAKKWEEQGCVTVGSVVDVKTIRRGDYDASRQDNELWVIYAYRVNGVTYQTGTRFVLNYPATVSVYYNPRNPKKCITSNDTTALARYKQGCLVTIIATLGSMFLVIHGLRLFF